MSLIQLLDPLLPLKIVIRLWSVQPSMSSMQGSLTVSLCDRSLTWTPCSSGSRPPTSQQPCAWIVLRRQTGAHSHNAHAHDVLDDRLRNCTLPLTFGMLNPIRLCICICRCFTCKQGRFSAVPSRRLSNGCELVHDTALSRNVLADAHLSGHWLAMNSGTFQPPCLCSMA